jgi:hypothetical protein
MSCDAGSGQVQSLARTGWQGTTKGCLPANFGLSAPGQERSFKHSCFWGLPTGSHDHRFEAENTRGRSDLFHLTMTWKRLGLNRDKTDLC